MSYKYQGLSSVLLSQCLSHGLCVLVPYTCFYPLDGWNHSGPLYISWFLEGANLQQDLPVDTNKPGQKLQKGTWGHFLIVWDL